MDENNTPIVPEDEAADVAVPMGDVVEEEEEKDEEEEAEGEEASDDVEETPEM